MPTCVATRLTRVAALALVLTLISGIARAQTAADEEIPAESVSPPAADAETEADAARPETTDAEIDAGAEAPVDGVAAEAPESVAAENTDAETDAGTEAPADGDVSSEAEGEAAVGVSPEEAAADGIIHVPEELATLTEAIEAAQWGQTILVGPGIYKESIVLTDQAGDGIILKSTNGPGETTIAYGEVASVNEAVVTFQRCTNSTQLMGFTIDGRGTAKRGILANSESKPVLADLIIEGADYGIASHRSSYPYVVDVTIRKSSIAGLFIQGGSADAKGCTFTAGEKFGVYIRGTADPVRMRDCRVTDNGQVGIQATDGEFAVEGGLVSGNADTGLILQDVSPTISNVVIEGHSNIGIVMEASSATISGCTIRENGFGTVISIEGEPTISSCTFENNPSYHVGIEGDANPTIGGSLSAANRFLGEASFSVQSSSSQRVTATHNYWDKPCVPKDLFQVSGGGRLIRKPWASPDLEKEFDDCTAARKYAKKWREGKLPTSPPDAIAQAEREAAKEAAKAKRRAEREAARAAAEAAAKTEADEGGNGS